MTVPEIARPPRLVPDAAHGVSVRALRVAWAALVVALVLVHGVLPLLRPLAIDTMYTGGKALLDWPDLLADTRENPFEPLYFLLMKAWCSVAGVSVAALIAPGAAATVAAPCVLAWAIRPWVTDPWTRWTSAALAGLHVLPALHWSQNVKPYAELGLLAAFSAGAWIRALDAARDGRSATRWLGALAAASVLGCQLHFPGVFAPLAVAIHAAFAARSDPRLRRCAAWAVAILAVSGGSVLFWTDRIRARVVDGVGVEWVALAHRPAGLAGAVADDLRTLVYGCQIPAIASRRTGEVAASICVLVLAAVLLPRLAAARGRSRGGGTGARPGALLACSILVPFAALALLEPIRPLYFVKYVTVAVLPVAVLCAVAVEGLRRTARPGVGAVAVALLLAGRAAGFATVGLATTMPDAHAQYALGAQIAARSGATVLVLPPGRWHETWTRWIDHVEGDPPAGVAIAWAAGDEVAAALAGHRRAVVVARLGVPAGWHGAAAGPSAPRYDPDTGRTTSLAQFLLLDLD